MIKFKLQNIFAAVCLTAVSFQSQAVDTQTNSIPVIFPTLEQAQPEIAKLNEQITAIEARYEKEIAEAGKQIERRYSAELNALNELLKNERQDESESPAEFKARQESRRSEVVSQRDLELAKLGASKAADAEVAPLKFRIKALTEHEYIVGVEGIETELGAYDTDKHQITIKLRSKFSALGLKLTGTIPLQAEEAQLFLKQWQAGLIKPEALAKLDGELDELALVNAADNTRRVELKNKFYSPANLKALPPATLNNLFQTGKSFKDCLTCPDLVVIPAGSFEMGTNNGATDEKPVHRVSIKQPFALGKTEITQGEWKAVMGNSPSYFKNCGDTCPVEQVSWNDAKEFIQKLNVKTGRKYRLPSEAEWEYACRAGDPQEYCGGDKVDSLAWYYNNGGGLPHSAAQKQANAWGLFDMSGNVWEWVEDGYHDDYHGAPVDGSAWQGNAAQRVIRGGAWNLIHELVRTTTRSSGAPVLRDYYYGFRVARTLP